MHKGLLHDAESTNMSHLEFLKKLLEIEAEGKKIRKQEKLKNAAGFYSIKRLEDIDYSFNPSLDYEKITALGKLDFIEAHENSVHENPCDAEDSHGNHLDFLDVYRDEKEIEDTLDLMTDREREVFINIYFRDIPDEMPQPMSRKAYLEVELIHLRNENSLYKSYIRYKHLEKSYDEYKEPKFEFVPSAEKDGFTISEEDFPFKEVLS